MPSLLKRHVVVDHDGGNRRGGAINIASGIEQLDGHRGLVAVEQEAEAVHQLLGSVGLALDPVIANLADVGVRLERGQSGVGLLDHIGTASGHTGQLQVHLDVVAGQAGTEHRGINRAMASGGSASSVNDIPVASLGRHGGHAGIGGQSAQNGLSSIAAGETLQRGGAVGLAAAQSHPALNGQNLSSQGTLGHHDVGGQRMNRIAVVAIDHSVVLEVLVGDQFLGGRDHHEVEAGILAHVHRGDDVDTVLAGGVDAEVVADLHAGDLGVIGEDPVDTVLQVTNQVRMAVADHDGVVSLQLVLQTGQHTLEVLTGVLHPVGDVVGELLVWQSIEVAADDQAVVVQEANSHGAGIGLGVERGIQEVTNLEVFKLGQGTTHDIHVIGDVVDVLSHEGIGSVFDGDGGVQSGAGFRHDELDGLHAADGGDGTIVPAVGNLAAQGNVGHIAVLGQDGDLTGHEINGTENLVGDGGASRVAEGVGSLILDVALGPLMSRGIGTNVGGQHHAVAQGNSANADVLSQLHGRVVLHDAGDVGGIDQGQSMQSADLDGILSDGRAGAGGAQAAGNVGIVVHIGDGVLGAVHGTQEALLNGIVDHRRGGNLGHQDILENSGNPLLLQEEGVVSNDGAVAGHNGLDSDIAQRVLLQLTQTIRVVVVEPAVLALSVREDGRLRDGLHHGVQELFTSSLGVQNLVHHIGNAGAMSLIGFQHLGYFGLETQAGIGRVVVTSNTGISHGRHGSIVSVHVKVSLL